MSQSRWARVPALPEPPKPPEPEPEPAFCCLDAARLFASGQQLSDRLIQLPDNPTALQVEKAISQVNDARLQFVDRYFVIRSSTPKAHKDRMYDKHGNPCLHAVFIAWYERFREYLIQIKPAPLAMPPKQPMQPRKKEAKSDWITDLAEQLENGDR